MLVLAVIVGVAIGVSLGALGGGGSILTVPALVYLVGQNVHGATTGSLVVVGVAALAGMVAHARAGRVRFVSGLVFGALGVAGSLVGSRLSAGIDPPVLLSAFAGLMLVAAAAIALRTFRARPVAASPNTAGDTPRVPATSSVPPERHSSPACAGSTAIGGGIATTAVIERDTGPTDAAALSSPTRPTLRVQNAPDVLMRARSSSRLLPRPWTAVRVLVAATVVGLLTGFFGVGGGFVVVPALVVALGFDMPEAVGTSLLVITINSGVSLLARLGTHVHLDWRLLAIFAAAAIAGSIAGNRIAATARPERLTLAFTILLVAVALYTAGRSLPHLV